MLVKVAVASLFNRRLSALLTILAITVSTFVFLSVEHIRSQAKTSFSRTVSGVDLIVGPRAGQLNLLLATVFRVGSVQNSISMASVNGLAQNKLVKWSVPIALGDSHKGFRVLGTTAAYFEHFKFGNKQPLDFALGQAFNQNNEMVLGADIAKKLGYGIGSEVVLSHGVGVTSFSHHEQYPFVVSGILERTGTPVDQTLHVSLMGMHLMHEPEHSSHHDEHETQQVSALLLGLKAKFATLVMQQQINKMKHEPLMAIVPGVALSELWRILGSVETILRIISLLVLVAAMLGMSTMLLASMRERKKEIAILRAMGAGPGFIFTLIESEVAILTLLGVLGAYVLLFVGIYFLSPVLASQYGVFLQLKFEPWVTAQTIMTILGLALTIGLVPAVSAYRQSLQAGLSQ
mgnify:CR=1 FL=1